MYASGLRASETIWLEIRDVDLEQGVLRARGKGSKERVVPVGGKAIAAVRVYLRSGRPKLVHSPEESKLFLNFRGGPLTRQGLYKIVLRHAESAGLDGPDEPTHPFATPSPPICWPAAATCARSRRCSGMPTSRPPSSTPTFG